MPEICFSGELLMRRSMGWLSAGRITLFAGAASAQNDKPRNLILFVPDGLRGQIVTPQTAPAMAEVRDKGVNFKNSHSLFPNFTPPTPLGWQLALPPAIPATSATLSIPAIQSGLRTAPSRRSSKSIRLSST